MMMLGMCTFLTGEYDVESNRESGKGRSDIILKAKTGEKPNIVMEFKYIRDEKKDLRELAEEALEQIERKDYAAGLQGEVVCIGLGHRGKEAEMEWSVREVRFEKNKLLKTRKNSRWIENTAETDGNVSAVFLFSRI